MNHILHHSKDTSVANEQRQTIYTNGLTITSPYSKMELTFADHSIWLSLTPLKEDMIGEDPSKIRFTDYMSDYKINFALGSNKLGKLIHAIETIFDAENEAPMVYVEDNISPDKSFKRLSVGGSGTIDDEGFENGWITLEAFDKKGNLDLRIELPLTVETIKFFKSPEAAAIGKKPSATSEVSSIETLLEFLKEVRFLVVASEHGTKLASANSDNLLRDKPERKKYIAQRGGRGSTDDEDEDEDEDEKPRPAQKRNSRPAPKEDDDEEESPRKPATKKKKVASARDLLDDEDED